MALRWVDEARALLLAGAWLWSLWLALRILRRERSGWISLAAAAGFMASAGALAAAGWGLLF